MIEAQGVRHGSNHVFRIALSGQSLSSVLEGTRVATQADSSLVMNLQAWISKLPDNVTENTSTALITSRARDTASILGPRIPVEHLLATVANAFAEDDDARIFARFNIAIAVWREISQTGNHYSRAQLQKIWEIILEAITKTTGTRFRFTAARSAQGFLAVPLCSRLRDGRIDELLRFHVWLPDNQRGLGETSIHAHQPFAQSWILAGWGENSMYHVKTVSDPAQATHAIYALRWSDGNQAGKAYKTHQISSTVENTDKFVRVIPGEKAIHTRDMSYAIPAGECHGSMVPGGKLHATLFFFDSSRGFDEDAMVIGPKNGKDYTQIRDPAGVTPLCLAQLTDAARRWEQNRSLSNIQNE